MVTECTNAKLATFSFDHLTYINQIFGDLSVRQIIHEVYKKKRYAFGVEETGDEFEHSHHHFVIDKKTKQVVCSAAQGYQNIYINKNDNLCQSYSLLTYFGIPINPDQKQRQMDMIALYRRIISNKQFIKKIDDIIDHPSNKEYWQDSTHEEGRGHILMNKDHILKKINDVLNEWENYGYWYFIGEGKCPVTQKKKQQKKQQKRTFGGNHKTIKTKKSVKKRTRMKY